MQKIKKVIQSLILFMFLSIFSFVLYWQANKIQILENEIDQVVMEIENEKKTTEKLEKEYEYAESDAFIEKIARERLGLVKHDEIIFIIEENK